MEDKYYTESHKKAIDRYDKDFNNTEKNVHNKADSNSKKAYAFAIPAVVIALLLIAFIGIALTGSVKKAVKKSAIGLLSYIEGLDEKDQVTELESIYKEVMDNVYKVTTDDKKVKQLIKILGDYELKPKFDEQMNELYHMGYADKTIR